MKLYSDVVLAELREIGARLYSDGPHIVVEASSPQVREIVLRYQDLGGPVDEIRIGNSTWFELSLMA